MMFCFYKYEYHTLQGHNRLAYLKQIKLVENLKLKKERTKRNSKIVEEDIAPLNKK